MADHYRAEQFIKAMPGTGGIKTAIAKKVGCDRATVAKYIDKYVTVRRAWEQESERIGDLAEGELFKKVHGGDSWAIKYILSTRFKGRGYTQKTEIEHSGEQVIRAEIEYVNNWRENDQD